MILRLRLLNRLPLHVADFVRAAASKRDYVIDLVARARAGRQAGRRARVLALELPPDSRAPPDSARWGPRARFATALGAGVDGAGMRRTGSAGGLVRAGPERGGEGAGQEKPDHIP